MKKILKYLFSAGIIFLAASCYDDPGTEIIFDGLEIEINEATLAGGVIASKAYVRANDGIAKRDSIRINLAGAHQNSAVSVGFSLDASNTAVAGVHYNLLSTSPVEIPANSSFTYIYFEVLADNIEQGENWTLKFNLTSTTAGELSANYSSFTRGLQILCPFVRNNFLGSYSCLEPGYGTYAVTFTADTDPARPNSIVVNNFWDFGGVVRYEFSTNSSSPSVTLPTQSVVMGGNTYTVSQNGAASYNPCEYSFVVPYRVVLTATGVTQDTNVHTFTKN
mgnify:CR=1 FL=1